MIHWLAACWHWEQAESAESIIMARAMLVKLGRAEITVAASFSPRHLSHTPIRRIICCVPFRCVWIFGNEFRRGPNHIAPTPPREANTEIKT